MSTPTANARELLECAPGEYVTERARLVKAARLCGDRDGAKALQALSRPPLGFWAVLAAAGNVEAVAALYEATADAARVQAAGAGRQALTEAVQRRRIELERFVDAAVAALARWERGAEARRSEIRDLVDRLSRRPDLAEAWLAGVLREAPDDALGFAAFADVHVAASNLPVTAPRSKSRATRTAPPALDADADARRAEAARAADRRQATTHLAVAEDTLVRAEQQVEEASRALRRATADLEDAERNRAHSIEQRARAAAKLAALQGP